ncbi:MAG: outer membrane protein TolC [Paraglaciecola sp.]|jgi:outer membrane protein TolC
MQQTYKFHNSWSSLRIFLALICTLSFGIFADTTNTSTTNTSTTIQSITMQDAVKIAIQHDPWLTGNQLQEKALRASSKAASYLPDPMLSIGLLNLPSDGFAFNQEPMTQFKLGIAQAFPRGDSLVIKQQQLSYQADQHPYHREDRKAKIQVTVSQLWLDAIKADQTISLIKRNRVLFEQLVDIVKASYSSAQGNTRQQDVISAQVELARLDDRLTALSSQRDSALTNLSEWLPASAYLAVSDTFEENTAIPSSPELADDIKQLLERTDNTGLLHLLGRHPSLLAIEQSAKAGITAIKLAEQKYKPQWGVNASYAYRDDDPFGQSRADFFSLGITVDIPIFGSAQQDSEVAASRLTAQVIETDKRLLQQRMLARMLSLYQQEIRFGHREEGFLNAILPQVQELADASLNAYTHDDGDFSEVMRAQIAQLTVQIDLIDIQIEKHKIRMQLGYFLEGHTNSYPQGEYR